MSKRTKTDGELIAEGCAKLVGALIGTAIRFFLVFPLLLDVFHVPHHF